MDSGPTAGTAQTGLRRAAQAGPYFVVETWEPDAGWRPWTDLLDDPDAFAERVKATRSALAESSGVGSDQLADRPLASIAFLGIVSRLISPVIGSVALAATVPELRPADVWWRPSARGPWPLAVSASRESSPADPVRVLHDRVVVPFVAPLVDRVAVDFALSGQVLWGNVASAVAGAAAVLSFLDLGTAERAGALAGALLELGPLRGTGRLVRPDPARARWFLVRQSCCLYYRLPGGGTCADCVLTPPARRAAHWKAMLAAG